MGRILMFSDLKESALARGTSGYVLFGVRDLIQGDGYGYDMLFHGRSGVSLDELARLEVPADLTVPVFNGTGYTDAEIKEEIAWNKLLYTDALQTVMIANRGELGVYDVTQKDWGLSFTLHGGDVYLDVSRETFSSVNQDPAVAKYISQTSLAIDRLLRPVASRGK